MNPRGCAALVCCVVWIGCRSPESNLQHPEVSHQRSGASRVQLADQALAESARPDYRRPMLTEPIDRSAVSELYLAACRAGDKRSCWLAMEVQDSKGVAEALVRDNCRAGHSMSCRALPAIDVKRFDADAEASAMLDDMGQVLAKERIDKGLPGSLGRSHSCHNGYNCDRDALQQECEAGFPNSCEDIVKLDERTHDMVSPDEETFAVRIALITRIVRLARQGCHADIVSECYQLAFWKPDVPDVPDTEADDRLFGYERLCRIGWSYCDALGDMYLAKGNREKAQVAYERACQGDPAWCNEAVRGYLDDHLPEPVPHRGRDLAEWACQHDEYCRPELEHAHAESPSP